ncbi:MAG: adenylate/guanylate cyclase domain-containing protein [Verrucomicrobiae bacterium]|jgi:class 3 adenylate cyclase/HAMP domain-containing protein|nr:adenylate/guanylate cyclase domain-containing protein [Verrucomicrobiae bacterium]
MGSRGISFRVKLVAAMMLVVGGVTATTLYVAQDRLRASHDQLFEQRFRSQVALFDTIRRARLTRVRERCSELARSVRIGAAMEEEDWELLYQISRDELRDITRPRPDAEVLDQPPVLIRFIRPDGAEIFPEDEPGSDNSAESAELKTAFRQVSRAMADGVSQRVGYVSRGTGAARRMLEVIATKIVFRPTGQNLGALVIGFDAVAGTDRDRRSQTGIWVDGEMVSRSVRPNVREALRDVLATTIRTGSGEGSIVSEVDGEPHRVFFQSLTESAFLPAYQLAIFSLAESVADEAALRQRMTAFGAVVLCGALIISLLMSRGLTEPIGTLVEGTGEIQRGNFSIRLPVRNHDEIGRLTESFNEMAEGLAQKEKFQSVLNMVTDKAVAEELMRGDVSLGGELREISVIFCDIRGFTAMTQNMTPTDVIALMNEHFTELTRIVYRHHGVVDKFVGDLIMAVFGAPKSYGNDADNAARCCLEMIAACEKRNRTATQPIHVGIGLASGQAVAGCMGSEDRLNYTVMGARVNLASRLCSAAGIDEIVIDRHTFERLPQHAETEALPAFQVKGFDEPVRACKLKAIPATPHPA